MRSRLYVYALSLLLPACTDSVDPSRLLVGTWGSPTVELIALRFGAELRRGCDAVVIDDPIELGEDGTFRASGTYWGSGMIIGDRPRAVVSGSLTGNVVTVLVERGPIEGATYTLEAGVSRAPIEPTCPL